MEIKSKIAQRFLDILLLTTCYFYACIFSDFFTIPETHISLFWFPLAISLAWFLKKGTTAWPGVFLGSFLFTITTGRPVETAIIVATATTAATVWGAKKIISLKAERLKTPQDLIVFVTYGVIGISVISALSGGFILWLKGTNTTDQLILKTIGWFGGDLISLLVFTPFLLAFFSPWNFNAIKLRYKEAIFLTGALIAAFYVSFTHTTGIGNSVEYLSFPILFWIAYRFKSRFITAALVLFSFSAINSTMFEANYHEVYGHVWLLRVLELHAYIIFLSLSILFLSAVARESRQKNRKYTKDLEDKVRERTASLSDLNKSLQDEIDRKIKAQDRSQLLQFALNNTAEAILIIDANGFIQSCNPTTSLILGYDENELENSHVSMLSPDYSLETWPIFVDKIAITKNFRIQVNHLRKDGTLFPAVTSVSQFEYADKLIYCAFLHDLTNIDKQNNELTLLNKQLADAESLAGIGHWHWDAMTDKTFWSIGLQQIMNIQIPPGVDPPDYSDIVHFFHPDDRDNLEAMMRDLLPFDDEMNLITGIQLKGNRKSLYHRVILSDGKIRYLFSELVLEVDTKGAPLKLWGTAQDITEIKKEEERFRLALKSAQLGTWDIHIPSQTVVYNERWAENLGYSLDEIGPNGKTWEDLVHPDDFPAIRKIVDEALHDHTGRFTAEYRMRTKSGKYKWILEQATAIEHDLEGNPVRLIGTHMDITERRLNEESRRRERELFVSGPAVIFSWRPEPGWPVNYVSKNIAQFGYTTDDFLINGLLFADVIHPDDRERISEEVSSYIENQTTHFDQFYRIKKANGNYVWTYDFTVISYAKDGTVERIQGYILNDQKRKNNEAQLALQAAQLQLSNTNLLRSNRALQEFAYVASHDLQEPLRKITAYTNLLQRRTKDILKPEHLDYINRMSKATGRAQNLIRDLLSYSRITSTEVPFENTMLSLIVADVLEDLELKIAEQNAIINVSGMPVIEANQTQMHQLFFNLIGNALKFSNANKVKTADIGQTTEISIDAVMYLDQLLSASGPHCKITITDNGIGIDDIYKEQIFTPFQRLHPQEQYEGTGIGLAMCRQIVERHGGKISVKDNPAGGSSFVIILPITQPIVNKDSIVEKQLS